MLKNFRTITQVIFDTSVHCRFLALPYSLLMVMLAQQMPLKDAIVFNCN